MGKYCLFRMICLELFIFDLNLLNFIIEIKVKLFKGMQNSLRTIKGIL